MSIQKIRIDEITFGDRARKDYGDLKDLANSIKELGLMNPITVAKTNGGYALLAGGRRTRACRDILGWSMIQANVYELSNATTHRLMERDENEQRKPLVGLKGKESRDVAAEEAGLGSGKTYDAATKVVEHGTPELVQAMDDGTVTISDAAVVAEAPPKKQRKAVAKVRSGRARTVREAVRGKQEKCPACGRTVSSSIKFVKPTLQEVTAYCRERNNTVDPQQWLDHYTSNGWKVGRNAMKDWKAAVRTWERMDKQRQQKPKSPAQLLREKAAAMRGGGAA